MISDNKKEQELNQADIAASFFSTNIKKFRNSVRNLSARGKERVLNAVMEYPLQQKAPVFPNTFERDLFDLGASLTQAKIMMTIESLHQNELKRQQHEENNNGKEELQQSGQSNEEQDGESIHQD